MAATLKDLMLVPFYVTACLYFLLVQPLVRHPDQSVFSAFFKVLPIWSLAFFVYSKNLASGTNENVYPSAIFVGLLISSIGDVFIVWHETLFNLGVVVFATAHLLYTVGTMSRCKSGNSSKKLLYFLIVCAFLLLVTGHIDQYSDKVMCVVYFSLIGYLAWLTSLQHENENSDSSYYAMVGMCVFLFSDFVITIDRVSLSLPFSEMIAMITYYAAQCCLALSTVNK